MQDTVTARKNTEGNCRGASELVNVMNGKVPLRALLEALLEMKYDRLAKDIWSSAGACHAS